MTRTRISHRANMAQPAFSSNRRYGTIIALTMACVMFSSLFPCAQSFVPISKHLATASAAKNVPFDPTHMRNTQLYAEALQDIESMRAGEIRKELESYGISCKSFFEKSELVDALKKARAEGKTTINGAKVNGDTSASSSTTSSGSSTSAGGGNADSGASREEKIKAEMEKCKTMKVGDLKKELQSLGVSTKSFFEKSEFVKALAEARVDGVKKRGGAGQGFGRGSQPQEEDEPYDPSYRDVVMQKMNVDPRDPRMGRGPLIDIQLGR